MFQHHVGFSRYVTYVAVLLLAACATKSQQIAPQATGGLTDVRAQAVALKQQLSRTTDAARKVSQSSATDLKNSLEILSSLRNSDVGVAAAYGVVLMLVSAAVFAAGAERGTAG